MAKDQVKDEAYESDAKKAAWFRKELKYVVSRADVILQVLDSRDPNGCRCPQLEQQAISAGKRVVLIMNKVDLVPKPVVKSWLEGRYHTEGILFYTKNFFIFENLTQILREIDI